MYKLISDIAERCHTIATKRGKDTGGVGCMLALSEELREYREAVDNSVNTSDFAVTVVKAIGLPDKDFRTLYSEKIHNTTVDELADILIVAATWLHSVKLENGDDFKQERSLDVMLLNSAVRFIHERLTGPRDLDELRTVVIMKMRYNEIRND